MLERDLEGLPEELVRAQRLIDDAKVNEATELLKTFRESGDLSFREIICSYFLESEAFVHQGRHPEAFKHLDQIYDKTIDLVESYFSIDALYRKAFILTMMQNMKGALELIKKAEKLLERMPHKTSVDYKLREARIIYVNGIIASNVEILEKSLKIREELGIQFEICTSLTSLAAVLTLQKGKINIGLDYIERAISIARRMNKKAYIYTALFIAATIYSIKGELDHSIKLFKEVLLSVKEYNNKFWLAMVMNNLTGVYRMSGQLEKALESINYAIELNNELGFKTQVAGNHDFLIQILIQMGDLERANAALLNLEYIVKELDSPKLDQLYRFDKALVLKTSSRTLNRGKAEEILRQLLEEDLDHETETGVLLNFCDLLLYEVNNTNDKEILKELNSFFNRLLKVAERSQSYIVLGESYLLRAKLALISFDLAEGRRLLKKGQKIAETYGLSYLAVKISNEHDNLLKKLDDWKDLKEKQGSISERLDLARVRDQLEKMATKRVTQPTATVDEDPIVILIMTEGGNPIFSQSFIDEWNFEDHLFSSFLSAMNSFSGEMLSEELDRASFGEYTLLMHPVSPFIACYLFKGQSYKAQKRIKCFIKKIQEVHSIWETLNSCRETNRHCQLGDIPPLEPLIIELFIEKKIKLSNV